MRTYPCFSTLLLLLCCISLKADLWLPSIFGDHMVLQCEQTNPIWGKASPGQKVTVKFAGESYQTQADSEGRWRLDTAAMQPGGPYEMTIKANEKLIYQDVWVGEVWVCSGQSNMQWAVLSTDEAALEMLTANFQGIRHITIPQSGTQEPQDDFDGNWATCTPENIAEFSAIGYFFGRHIHNATGRVVGLIDNSWGGSSAEAWTTREVLEQHPQHYAETLKSWDERMAVYTDEDFQKELSQWKAEPENKRRRWPPEDPRYGKHRPANIYNGMVNPIEGFGIRGIIWYQGESNAGRAENYKHLFPLMITNMRDRWGQGDFPFYWVQLADFMAESPTPQESNWAHLREAQTETLAVPNSGQAVIIDIGEGRDIHPRNKQRVADRLARHALKKDYGFNIHAESPRYKSMTVEGNTVTVTFDHVAKHLYAFDTEQVKGFALAGEDRIFHWAEARIQGNNQVVLQSAEVPEPIAVRYAWANNPDCNLYDREGLPVTPFRTDDW